MTTPTPEESFVTAPDRHQIFLRHWPVDDPKAVFVIAHGLGSYAGRAKNIVGRLQPAGYAVFGHDHRGHGKSAGRRGHVDRFDQYVDDLYLVVTGAHEKYPGKKVFLYGHSLGGLIALAYALRHADTINGVIASGSALKLALAVPAVKATVGRILSSVWPTLTLGNDIDANALSHDPEVVREYEADPLVHDRVSTRFYVEFTAAMDRTLIGAGALQMPLLAYHGMEDTLTSPEGTKLFFERAASTDKTLRLFEGQRHEVHNDTAKEELLDLLQSWLDSHV